MFDNILSRINKVNSWHSDSNQGLTTYFYQQVNVIHQELLAMHKKNAVVCRQFFLQNAEIFRHLDEKIIFYEKQRETTISAIMSGQSRLSGKDIAEALKNKATFIEFYRSLYFAERAFLAKTPEHFCHVGCGPMPASILMWMKYTSAKIMAIDFDPQAIASAQAVFEHWRHSKNIPADRATFINLPAEKVNYRDVDVVVISASVINKENVYSAILRSANREVTVIERTPNFLYNPAFTTPNGFEVYRLRGTTQGNVKLQSYQFTPNRGDNHEK